MEQLVSRIESLEGMMRKIGVVLGSEELSDTSLTAERETGDNVSDQEGERQTDVMDNPNPWETKGFKRARP